MTSNLEDMVIPQIEFIRYLLENEGRLIDANFIREVIEKFGADIIISPALAYIMARQ